MVKIKTREEINKMRKAGKLAAQVLEHVGKFVKVGVSTLELNNIAEDFTRSHNAVSAPLNYNGFPRSICTSVNDVVCHGIPSKDAILQDGDILNIDITVILNGYHGDTNKTFMVGKVSPEVELLVERTHNAMMRGIKAIKPNHYLYEVGKAIEKYINKFDYSIVRDYGGHGIGKGFHEDPHVYHFYTSANKIRLKPGMIFTVEPMINMSKNYEVITSLDDNWTVTTADGSLSAQFEHTVLVTDKGYEILTHS